MHKQAHQRHRRLTKDNRSKKTQMPSNIERKSIKKGLRRGSNQSRKPGGETRKSDLKIMAPIGVENKTRVSKKKWKGYHKGEKSEY